MINESDFNVLSDNEKRITLAKDVIERIKTQSLIQSQEGKTLDIVGFSNPRDNQCESLKDAFNENKCVVCAKGALIVSWIGNFNKYGFEHYGKFDTNLKYGSFPIELIQLFGREQLDLIERAYEGTNYSWYCDMVYNMKNPPSLYYKYNLHAIMKNIIENDGKFVPKLEK